jgi:hypothetical protein
LLLGRIELVIVALDAGAELDATKCMEVASVEHIGNTNLGSGRDMWMECGRDGKRESGQGRVTWAGVAPTSSVGGVRPASRDAQHRSSLSPWMGG